MRTDPGRHDQGSPGELRGKRWTRFWDAHGDFDLADGQTITAGEDSEAIKTDSYDPTVIGSGSAFTIYVHGDEPSASASFLLDPDTPAGHWARPDGSISAEPCESDAAGREKSTCGIAHADAIPLVADDGQPDSRFVDIGRARCHAEPT